MIVLWSNVYKFEIQAKIGFDNIITAKYIKLCVSSDVWENEDGHFDPKESEHVSIF